MPHTGKLGRRVVPLLAFALVLGGCDTPDPTAPLASADPVTTPAGSPASFLTAGTGGIPFGFYHMPNEMYGPRFTGSLRGMSPSTMLKDLETARKAGASVIVSFVGNEKFYKNANGTFSLAKWKARLDPFRNLNFASYIADGTIVGHYLIDEPHDWGNWNNTQVSPATLEEMARYSKQLWPGMPTIVRTFSWYLKGRTYQYLDAAWAQYALRFGAVKPWLDINVRDAKAAGLGLVIGMNIIAGSNSATGLPGFYSAGYYAMNAAQVTSVSSAMLDNPYPCAFISWKYDERYAARSDIKAALATVGAKARARPFRSCRGAASGNVSPPPAPPKPPTPPAPPAPPKPPAPPAPSKPPAPPAPAPPTAIQLIVAGRVTSSHHYMRLTWSGAKGSTVDVYRNGSLKKNTLNDRIYTNKLRNRGAVTYVYKVCEKGTSRCSKAVAVSLRR